MFRICHHTHTQSGGISGSDVLPTYNPFGGPKGKGHLSFNRFKSQFLDAGPRTLNIASNGGLTIVTVVRFTGAPGDEERIIECASGSPDNNIILKRAGTSTSLGLQLNYGNTYEGQIETSCDGVIVQDTWLTVVLRYNAATCTFVIKVITTLATTEWPLVVSKAVTDRTVSGTWIGKNRWFSNGHPYFNGDVAGVFVVDEYLSDAAVCAVTAAIEEGEDPDVAFRAYREVCCICTLDWGYECSMCDGCNQSWTHLKALENKVSAGAPGPVLSLEEITSTRALVGISLQYRLDLIVVNTLLQTSEGVDTLVSLMRDQGLQAEIQLGSRSIKIVSEDGNLDLSVSAPAREAARREKEKGLPVKLSRSIIPAHLRMRSVSKAEGLAALVPNGKLKTLNVSHNTNLKLLPVEELMEMECLTSIECRGCSRLYCPPPEIAELKGDQVVSYLKSALVKHGGMLNTAVEMIAIGNGESGKTSIIRALMHGTSEKIHEDKRTVGIDLKTWDLSEEEDLVFHIKDLAGQAVYSLTNQFFLVQRAIYLLVWRVDKGKSSDTESWEKKISDMVLTWMESLQLRVPGASLLLVVTHIDLVSQEELERQIKFVQKLVKSKMQDLGNDDDDVSGVVPLTVWNEGRSMPVACLLGQGVQELRQEVECST